MACAQDLEFNDDNHRALAKAKESILLMKKKMFLSHDLILQYNNKVKECKRLEGDLCKAQDLSAKLRQENNINRSKIIKLEMQNSEYEKKGRELEQTIAEKDVQIAGDKSHLRQLECKLEAEEDKHGEFVIEEELKRSALEDKIKELVQELKTSKKSHAIEIIELKKTLKSPQEKKGKKIIEVVKATNEIGVNTEAEARKPEPIKPATSDKSVLTNEFYHIVDNPYPLFCDKCEVSMQPEVDKICGIMSHPPLIANMLSPLRSFDSKLSAQKQRPNRNGSNNVLHNGSNTTTNPRPQNTNPTTNEKNSNLIVTTVKESNFNNFRPVEPFPQNFPTSLSQKLTTSALTREIQPSPVQEATVRELDDLKRKISALERAVKKGKKQKSLDLSSANFHNLSHSVNCCNHPPTPANPPLSNVFPQTQTDVMTEFMNRMLNLVKERDRPEKFRKIDSPRKKRTLRNEKARIKLRKHAEMEMSKKKRNKRSNNWKIDSCEGEVDTGKKKNVDGCNTIRKSHLLRIKRNCVVDSTETLFNDEETEKLSHPEDSWEASWAETETRPPENAENSSKTVDRIDTDSGEESSIVDRFEPKIERSKGVTRARKRKLTPIFGTDDGSDTDNDSKKNNTVEKTQTRAEKRKINATTRNKRLREEKIEKKSPTIEISALKKRQTLNSLRDDGKIDSGLISSDESVEDREIDNFSQDSSNNDVITNSKESREKSVEKSAADQTDVFAESNSDSEISGSMNLQDRIKLRKRKRANSPKTTKSAVRSKLLGKLRALKKNTNSTVGKIKNSTTIHVTRSLSRAKFTKLQLETENLNEQPKELEKNSLVSSSETSADLLPKKQRIAHIPKKITKLKDDEELPTMETMPTTSKTIENSEKIDENTDDESRNDREVVEATKPMTRRSAIEKLAEIKLKNDQNIAKNLTSNSTDIRRRLRTPAKRNAAVDTKKIIAPIKCQNVSSINEIKSKPVGEKSSQPNTESTDAKILPNDTKNSCEHPKKVEDNTAVISESPETERISKRDETELDQTLETENSTKSVKIVRMGLPPSITDICRRVKTPAKRNAAIDTKKIIATINSQNNPSINEINPKPVAEKSSQSITESTNLKNLPNDIKNSPEHLKKVEDNTTKLSESPETERILKSDETELDRNSEGLIARSSRSEILLKSSISGENASTNRTNVFRGISAEKSKQSASLEGFKASPVASIVLHDETSTKTEKFSILPSLTDVSLGGGAIGDDRTLNENSLCTKNSAAMKKIEASSGLINDIEGSSTFTVSSTDNASSEGFVVDGDGVELATKEKRADEEKMMSNDETISIDPKSSSSSPDSPNSSPESPNSCPESPKLSPESPNSSPELPNSSPESPNSSPESPDSLPISSARKSEISSSYQATPKKRESIYDNIQVPNSHEETKNSISSKTSAESTKNAATSNKFFIYQDEASDELKEPKEEPIERNLIVYDANFLDEFVNNEDEKFDSKNIVNLRLSGVKKESSDFFETTNVVKELRSRRVMCSSSTSTTYGNPRMVVEGEDETSQRDSYQASEPRSLGTLLNHYLSEDKLKSQGRKAAYLRKAGAMKMQETLEKNVKEELYRLVESEEWTMELHNSVVEKLRNIRSERTIAKSIVEILVERASFDEPLDKTYTPPAPIMSETQRKIVTLMNCLQEGEPTSRLFDHVQDGIEYTVWQSCSSHKLEILEYLVRMFTLISRIRKDRERVRILCCDALYFLARKALPLIYIILTIWPEVFPKHGTVESELSNCLAHVIMAYEVGPSPFPKVVPLKKMIANYYNYQQEVQSEVVVQILIKALNEKYSTDLEAAILLLSKRKGWQWALTNVVEKGLMPLIRDDGCQCQYEAPSLLGFILRPFPITDSNETGKKFIVLLSNMLASGKGSMDKQEGLVSALLGLARFKDHHQMISNAILTWTPGKELRPLTLEQLHSFFKSHPPMWWYERLQLKIKNERIIKKE